MRLRDKVAIVTGAGAGVGKAIALRYAREGAQGVVAEIQEATGEATAAEIAAAGGRGLFVRTDTSRSFVFRCTHFDPATRSCDSYDSRPGICRDYPRLLLWQPNPELLPGCGYRARPPNADGLKAALARVELTPDQRAKLEKGLRLDG